MSELRCKVLMSRSGQCAMLLLVAELGSVRAVQGADRMREIRSWSSGLAIMMTSRRIGQDLRPKDLHDGGISQLEVS